MPWETYRGRQYYVLIKEVDGKRHRKWIGTGEVGKQAEQAHEQRKTEIRRREATARAQDLLVDRFDAEAHQLFVELLTPYGCIRDQGRFRNPLLSKSGGRSIPLLLGEDVPASLSKEKASMGTGEVDTETRKCQLEALFALGLQIRQQASNQLDINQTKISSQEWRSGSSGAIAEETRWLNNPNVEKIGLYEGDDSSGTLYNAESRFSEANNESLKSLLTLEAAQLTDSIKIRDDSPIERLLKEQIITYWQDLHVKLILDVDFEPYEYYRYNYRPYTRRLNRAHLRLTKAVVRLARVQALNLPR